MDPSVCSFICDGTGESEGVQIEKDGDRYCCESFEM
jgi:hypothetical protein